jgi:hypothetical protein
MVKKQGAISPTLTTTYLATIGMGRWCQVAIPVTRACNGWSATLVSVPPHTLFLFLSPHPSCLFMHMCVGCIWPIELSSLLRYIIHTHTTHLLYIHTSLETFPPNNVCSSSHKSSQCKSHQCTADQSSPVITMSS